MIHITLKDYKRKAIMLGALVDELRKENKKLKDENAINRARLGDAKNLHEFDSDQIRDLKLKVGDLNSRIEDLHERLEKEQSDNCELQNLYSAKCKECDEAKAHSLRLADSYNRTAGEKAALEAAKKAAEDKFEKCYGIYEREGYVVVKEDYYSQLLTDAEKFRSERDKHNANRRKRRAAKKASHGKPE